MHGRGYQTSSFGPALTPPIVQHLMIANLVVFALQIMVPQVAEYGPVRPYYMWQAGHLWEPFTYMWLHGGLGHLAMNMFALWMFGSPLALAWGPRKFLNFYLFCGIGAGFVIATWPYLIMNLSPQALLIPTVGASGAIYGVLLAYSLTWPDRVIALIFPPITFRAIWLIPGLFLMTVFFGGGGISHIGHLGGVLMGWLYLRRKGHAGAQSLSLGHMKYRWKRYRMRQKLRSVEYEEHETRRRRGGGDDDHRVH
ncbi:MAG: rhomboid family intramembrane serine protease [Deltaproteobacteria bacterium]|nr:rhomboid family intramembrane serine protease [Deltaproteobacteria bacterium]